MEPQDSNASEPSDSVLPLPDSQPPDQPDENLAADLVRRKVAAAYGDEPDVQGEIDDLEDIDGSLPLSKHQRFIYDLTNSGQPLHEIQTAWHEYYAGLTDVEKHQVWQEFYATHAQASKYHSSLPSLAPAGKPAAKAKPRRATSDARTLRQTQPKPAKPLATQLFHSLAFGLAIGSIVLLIFLFSFFNERFIAPLIQPSRNINATPIISSTGPIDAKSEIIIPKINVQIPVVYGVNTVDESAVETALEDGVVHYADTALPGQNGNLVIVGHSSNNIFNKGKYKFAFVLLSRLESGDTFYIQKDSKRYTYQIFSKKIVKPNDVSVLGTGSKPATATLITCDPPGTSTNRLVVVGEQISPDVTSNIASTSSNTVATSARIVPGNSPSLWSRLFHIF